jgi:urea transport system substrate-binding protein
MSHSDEVSSEQDQFRTSPHVLASDDSVSRSLDSTSAAFNRLEAATSDSRGLSIGERIGRYEITGSLGAGGMGVVYKAHDTAIDRDVAIKVLAADIAINYNALQRFLVEARAAGRLSHPNAVAIYEIGEAAGIHYLIMEFAAGGSVSARMESQGALSILEATRVAIDAAKGLAAAHRAGLIHRDMKPANLLVAADGTIKIADFGLAKPTLDAQHQLTQQGQILGTPYFMSPEQCQARELDHRSDIYSLGATYYALLTGAYPYENEDSVVGIMYAHCSGEILDPRKVNRLVPEACAKIVARAVAKRPEDRYPSAEEMLADLETVFATLSGSTGIVLPSQLQRRTKSSTAPTATRRRYIALGGVTLMGAAAVALAGIWKGWTPTGDRSDAAAGAGNGLPLAAAPSGEPVKVGVLHSLTGTIAASGSSVVDATLFAIDEVNQSGGVLGRPVEAVVRDGRSDPQSFAAEAERLITDDHVHVVFGCWMSSGRKMVVPIVEEHNKLLVYPRLYEGIEESPNVFYLGATPKQQIIPAVQWAHDSLKKRRFFLVGSDYVFPRIANEIIKDQIKNLGAELAGEAYRPLGSAAFGPLVAEIVAAKPECILNTVSGDSNVAFFRALRAAGVRASETPTISFSLGEEEIRHLSAAQMAGDFAACCYFQSIDSDENRQFVARFRARFGPQRVVTDPMEAAYIGVKLWAAAVREANSLETRAVRQAMRGLRLSSPAGEVRIDPATQHAYKTPRIGRIAQDGQFEIVWTADNPVAPEPYPAERSAEAWRAVLHDLQRSWYGQWAAPQN